MSVNEAVSGADALTICLQNIATSTRFIKQYWIRSKASSCFELYVSSTRRELCVHPKGKVQPAIHIVC